MGSLSLLTSLIFAILPLNRTPIAKTYFVPKDSNAIILVDIRIPPSKLIFKKQEGLFRAAVDLELVVKSGHEKLKQEVRHFSFNFDNYRATKIDSAMLTRVIKLQVPLRDRYKLRIKLRDVENSDMLLEEESKLGPYKLMVSDLIPISEKAYASAKKELAPTEGLTGGRMLVWVGTSNLTVKMRFEVQTDDRRAETVWSGERLISVEDTFSIPLDSLRSGKYKLIAEFEDTSSGKTDERTLKFSIFNFLKLSDDEYEAIVNLLTYIAEPDEIEELLNTPDSLREQAWKEFWERRDPTPGTPENELMEEYMRRVEYANEHFSFSNIPGYRTDRGMIYIRYGPPDEIESHPFELDSPPYEIWRYYSLDLVFIFVDKSGVGDYELVYPYGYYFR